MGRTDNFTFVIPGFVSKPKMDSQSKDERSAQQVEKLFQGLENTSNDAYSTKELPLAIRQLQLDVKQTYQRSMKIKAAYMAVSVIFFMMMVALLAALTLSICMAKKPRFVGPENPHTNIEERETLHHIRRLKKKFELNEAGRYPINADQGMPNSFFDAYCRYGCGGMSVTFPYYYRPFFGYGYPLVGTESMFPQGYGGYPAAELMASQAGPSYVTGSTGPNLAGGASSYPGVGATQTIGGNPAVIMPPMM